MAEFTKITVNINKTLWAAFNLFAHSSFAIRRDALISTWIYRFFSTSQFDVIACLRDEIPPNNDDWRSIVRDLRRTFKRSLKPAVITLHAEIADQLNHFCDEKSINRDRFVEQIIYQALISDGLDKPMRDRVHEESVLYIGPLDMMVGTMLQMPYRPMVGFTTRSYLMKDGGDGFWPQDNKVPADASSLFPDDELPHWIDGLLFTAEDAFNLDESSFSQEKIMAPPVGYWVFLRAYRHHLFVPSGEYDNPATLSAHVQRNFADLLPPPIFERLRQSLQSCPQTIDSLTLLRLIYKSLAQATGIRDRGFEEPFAYDEDFLSGPKLF